MLKFSRDIRRICQGRVAGQIHTGNRKLKLFPDEENVKNSLEKGNVKTQLLRLIMVSNNVPSAKQFRINHFKIIQRMCL